MAPGSWSMPVRTLAVSSVGACWAEAGLPSERLGALLGRAWSAGSWDEATRVARNELAQLDIPARAYAAARSRKFDSFGRLLHPVAQGAILDVGAGGPDLLERLPADTRMATDILEADRSSVGIGHVVQSTPDALPFDDASFDTILMTGMAHHLDPDVRTRLLSDVHRCLRSGGRLAMVEETFDTQTGCGPAREPLLQQLSADFDALSRQERFDFLTFTDWWGNRVMKGSDEIPLPFTFLDLDGWRAVLAEAGLPIMHAEPLGLMSGGGHLATPRALIVCARE